MPFNTDKCEVIIFGKTDDTSHLYSLGDTTLRSVKEAKYLGVIMQSNLKFDRHITSKVNNASKILGCIKHAIYNAPMKAKLIAYLSLCRPILEYADTLWDPTNKSACAEIEQVQNQAIRFIANFKGRCGISDA